MDVAYQTVSFFYHLSLIVWLGGIITIGFLVAPAVFGGLASRDMAAPIMGRIHRKFQIVQFFCLMGLLISSMIILKVWENFDPPVVVRYLFIFAMVVSAVFHTTVVMKRLRLIREQIQSFDKTPESDPKRQEYSKWHKISVIVTMDILICGLIVLFLS